MLLWREEVGVGRVWEREPAREVEADRESTIDRSPLL